MKLISERKNLEQLQMFEVHVPFQIFCILIIFIHILKFHQKNKADYMALQLDMVGQEQQCKNR